MEQGRYQEALPLFQRMCELDRNNWQAHLGLGRCHFELGDHRRAFPHFQELSRLAPHEAGPAYLGVGEILLAGGQPARTVVAWFRHAQEFYQKRGDTDRVAAIRARMAELGMDP